MKGSHVKGNISVFKKCAPACARKKRLSTRELWRPCLRSGHGWEFKDGQADCMSESELIMEGCEVGFQGKREHILYSDVCDAAASMQDLKSFKCGEHVQTLQAHSGVQCAGERGHCVYSNVFTMSKSSGPGVNVAEFVFTML